MSQQNPESSPPPLCTCAAVPSRHRSGTGLCAGENLPAHPFCRDCGCQRVTYFKPDPEAPLGTVRATRRFECDACHGTQIAYDLGTHTTLCPPGTQGDLK